MENSCDKCGIYFNDAAGHRHRERDEKGKWTGKWLRQNCYSKDHQKNDPNSQMNIIKSLRDRRTGNLDPNSPQAKGDNFQELTCRWRSTVSTMPVEDLNKKLDNYTSPIDHSPDSELGIIQTRGKFYDHIERNWKFGGLERDRRKIFDNLICYCTSKDGKRIERIYIFPKSEIIKRVCISIIKNPMNTRGTTSITPWYEKYRVKDEVILKQVNDIWTKILPFDKL